MCYRQDNKDFRWRERNEYDDAASDHVYLVSDGECIGLAMLTNFAGDDGWIWNGVRGGRYYGDDVIDCVDYFGSLPKGHRGTFTVNQIKKWCPIPSLTWKEEKEEKKPVKIIRKITLLPLKKVTEQEDE